VGALFRPYEEGDRVRRRGPKKGTAGFSGSVSPAIVPFRRTETMKITDVKAYVVKPRYPDDATGSNIQGGEQGGRSVASI